MAEMLALPDPKPWLEILKAGGAQTAAVGFACGVFLLIAHWAWLPPLQPWMVIAAGFGFVLFSSLAIAALAVTINKVFPIRPWIVHFVNERRFRREVRDYLPYLSNKDREIIAFLLAKNHKQFTADQDGGHLVNLISRKFVMYACQPGQVFRGTDVPMRIPDNVWDILKEHQNEFPYRPARRGEVEPQPWRIPWMAR